MEQKNYQLDFRPATEEDLYYICEVELMPQNVPLIGHEPLEIHQACLINPDYKYWIAEIQVAGQDSSPFEMKKIGFVILKGYLNPHQSIELYRIALSRKHEGFGLKFLKFIQDVTFNKSNKHRLWLDVLTTNVRAIHVYEKAEFIREGCLRECSRDQQGNLNRFTFMLSCRMTIRRNH